jgi:hypothetical protein
MHCRLPRPQWSIPGVGVVRPGFDRLVIASSMSVGGLKKRLPILDLKQAAHHFDIKTPRHRANPRMQSVIDLTCAQHLDPLLILRNHDLHLGRHSIVKVEIAFDVAPDSDRTALETLYAGVGLLGKRYHQRGYLWSIHKPDCNPPAGVISGPTFYLENRKSGVNIKCYIRHEKLAGKHFGPPLVRFEWTLTGKAALVRHLSGNQIGDLLKADLNQFLERNMRLEKPDYVVIGKLFRNSRDRDPSRAAFLVLRLHAYRAHAQKRFPEWEDALWACQNSPAEIRGYLRQLRDKTCRKRRGRPKKHQPRNRRPITDYRIERCFRRIKLIPVP